MREELY